MKSSFRSGRRATRVRAQQAARFAGYDLTKQHFDSPIPDIDRLPSGLWDEPSAMVGVDLGVDAARDLVANELAPYLGEFRPPMHQPVGGGFFVLNGYYESVDAESLYAIVRHTKPRLLLELGSGASSHVIHAAQLANEGDGRPFAHEVFDPFPFASNRLGPIPVTAVHPIRTEDIALTDFARLTAGDILFVDTTHAVKTGGDVSRIILEILPRLPPGVLVHFHDVFFPYEYPREWVMEERRAWAEQYLLQAFLAFNDDFDVVFPGHAIARREPQLLAGLIPSFSPGASPSSFWVRRLN